MLCNAPAGIRKEPDQLGNSVFASRPSVTIAYLVIAALRLSINMAREAHGHGGSSDDGGQTEEGENEEISAA